MKIYLNQPTNFDKTKLFLLAQILGESAKKQGHEIIQDEKNADLIISLDEHLDAKFDGKKVFSTDVERAFNAPEDTIKNAISEAKIYSHNMFKNDNSSSKKRIVAVTACPTGVIQTFMSAEAIAEYAKKQGWDIKVETRGQVGANNLISKEDVEKADLVFLATDIDVDLSKFEGKLIYHTSTDLALKKTAEEFDKAFKTAAIYSDSKKKHKLHADMGMAEVDLSSLGHKNIVAVTACPTGVVHTFMSAEAIAEYAKKQGWDIKVETYGQQGANHLISATDIEKADLVFLATDIDIDLSKFKGKLVYHTSTELALKKTGQEFAKGFKEAIVYNG